MGGIGGELLLSLVSLVEGPQGQPRQPPARDQILPLEAVPSDEPNRFGDVYEIRGVLRGVNDIDLAVLTIWMIEHETNVTKFITLYPDKEARL